MLYNGRLYAVRFSRVILLQILFSLNLSDIRCLVFDLTCIYVSTHSPFVGLFRVVDVSCHNLQWSLCWHKILE